MHGKNHKRKNVVKETKKIDSIQKCDENFPPCTLLKEFYTSICNIICMSFRYETAFQMEKKIFFGGQVKTSLLEFLYKMSQIAKVKFIHWEKKKFL